MTFSIIIPSYRGIDLLKANLPSVLKVGADEIIIGDDASPDHDIEFLRSNYPQINSFRNSRNLGFGSNVNECVRRATGDILILLNLDAKPSPNIIKYLKQDFHSPQVFAVSLAEQVYGPTRMIFRNGMIEHAQIEPKPDSISPTFWVSGGTGAFRRTMWNQLGGLDPLFDPFYWEDIDLCLRAQKKGWVNLWDPRATVEHYHESTTGASFINQAWKRRIQERNHLLFTWKHLESTQLISHLTHLLARTLSHPGYLRILLQALIRKLKLTQNKKLSSWNEAEE